MSSDNDTKNSLFKIAEIARFFGMTPRMLRHYEKLGLLKPAFVDKTSRYRYYDINSCDMLMHIAGFKYIGMGLGEIKSYLAGRMSAEDVAEKFDRKIALLELKKKLILKHSKLDGPYTVTRDVFPARRCVTRVLTGKRLEEFVGRIYDFYGDSIRSGVKAAPDPSVFFEVLTEKFVLEDVCSQCFIEIANDTDVPDAVTVPAREVIRTTHYGKLGDAGKAFRFLEEYARRENLEIVGNPLFMFLEGQYRHKNSYCVRDAMYEVQERRAHRR